MGGCDRLPASQTPAAIAISVVAPGFIDLHQYGQDLASQRVKAVDSLDLTLPGCRIRSGVSDTQTSPQLPVTRHPGRTMFVT